MLYSKNEKQKLAEKAITRASLGLYFLEDCLRYRHGGTDVAYSRSWYILLSFNFELILNSLLILNSTKQKVSDIISEIKNIKPAHDFEKLSNQIPGQTLLDIGIKCVKKRQVGGFTEYVIETTHNEKIVVQDLIDVRYDFMKNTLRRPDRNETDRIKIEINNLHKIVAAIRNRNS